MSDLGALQIRLAKRDLAHAQKVLTEREVALDEAVRRHTEAENEAARCRRVLRELEGGSPRG